MQPNEGILFWKTSEFGAALMVAHRSIAAVEDRMVRIALNASFEATKMPRTIRSWKLTWQNWPVLRCGDAEP